MPRSGREERSLPLPCDGAGTLSELAAVPASGTVHLILDVTGYLE